MRTRICAVAMVAGLVTLGCGGSNGPIGPTVVDTPQVSRANIAVGAANPILTLGTTRNFRVSFDLSMTETAGLGASIDFIRIEPRILGVVVERQEIGSDVIVAQTGNNRLNASSSRSETVFIEFNNGDATDILLTVGFTDDRSNALAATFTITFG